MAYFTVGEINGHWWFITPEGDPFFSIGLNHIDSASIRYTYNIDIWKTKCGGDQLKWIKELVAPSLKKWGFNTIGWVQETSIKYNEMHRHSPNWTHTEYRTAGMPYCHMLPFAEVHQWEIETRYPDVFNEGFADWCDYVARQYCAAMAEDPLLIGYFYSDCPCWIHETERPTLKGAWFDPERYKSDNGKKELYAMAKRYYKVTHDAIRRYDKNHLILGDRYEGKKPLPEEVVMAAVDYVDVLCFQYFANAETILPYFERWHNKTGKPILLADASVVPRNKDCPLEVFRKKGNVYDGQGEKYEHMMELIFNAPYMTGWHYCGAFSEGEVRRQGLYNVHGQENEGILNLMTKKNHDILKRMKNLANKTHGR